MEAHKEMACPKKQEIVFSALERTTLFELARSRTTPHGLVIRAQIVLASADGEASISIARRMGVSMPTVGKWRRRFLESGLVGLYDEHRPGCPRTLDDEKVANLLQTDLESAPTQGAHWSVRIAVQATGISKSSVQRYFRVFGIQPQRTKSFKLNDPRQSRGLTIVLVTNCYQNENLQSIYGKSDTPCKVEVPAELFAFPMVLTPHPKSCAPAATVL
jgi:transposase